MIDLDELNRLYNAAIWSLEPEDQIMDKLTPADIEFYRAIWQNFPEIERRLRWLTIEVDFPATAAPDCIVTIEPEKDGDK